MMANSNIIPTVRIAYSFWKFEIGLHNQDGRDYMTESPGNEPGNMLFDRIGRMVNERGVDISQHLNGNSLRLEFADGQRIVINFDVRSNNVWLASRSGGLEFIRQNNDWRTPDQNELLSELSRIIELTIASNPLNARAPSPEVKQADPTEAVINAEVKKGHVLRNALIVLLTGAVGFWAAQQLRIRQQPQNGAQQTQTLSLNKRHYQCESSFPANGSVTPFPESGLRPGSPSDPEIVLQNDHSYPVLLILSAPHTATPAMSILVHARQRATARIPAGQYDMMFSVGSTWCNPRSGFSEGQLLKIGKTLTVQMDKPVQLVIKSSGTGMEDFQPLIRKAHPELDLPPPIYTGDGGMKLQRQSNGHFYLPGSIEGTPVIFKVDTGAAVTSISSDLARQVGISNCKEVQLQTANSAASGCVAFLPRMMLGKFVVENITVAVIPNLETNVLGGNVLGNFQVSQNDNGMLIGRRLHKETK